VIKQAVTVLAIILSLSTLSLSAADPKADWAVKIEAAIADLKAPATPEKPRKLLIYTMASGFVHSSIPIGAKCVDMIGKKTGAFEATISNDPAVFDDLSKYDGVLMMSTTGNFLVPPIPKTATPEEKVAAQAAQKAIQDKEPARKQAIIDFLKAGKGIAGIHAASDAYYKNWPEWGEIIGGYFNGHPWGKINVRIDDAKSPINAVFEGKQFDFSDEIYTFKDTYSREKLHVLLSIDLEKSGITKGENRADHDYGVAWIREYEKGRVFYTLFGHREDTYANPMMCKFFIAGLQYALGDLKADATPSAKLK
jgi:type 1 glutamine amidotransferase